MGGSRGAAGWGGGSAKACISVFPATTPVSGSFGRHGSCPFLAYILHSPQTTSSVVWLLGFGGEGAGQII